MVEQRIPSFSGSLARLAFAWHSSKMHWEFDQQYRRRTLQTEGLILRNSVPHSA